MVPLPIDSHLPAIVESLRASPNLVIVAEPGAGKTTRVPPAIIRAAMLPRDNARLTMLQPRRIAARAAAARIADENGWGLGREVGYHVRFDRRLTDGTAIRVLTEGILTRQLLEDADLDRIGCVILDEFHERSIHTDLAIALLREVQQTIRPDLRIIVMSATLDAGPVAEFLGNAPVLNIPGRTFPVEIRHGKPSSEFIWERVAAELADWREDGDLLVFLPGAEEIRRTESLIGRMAQERSWVILPLYGALTPEQQDRALRPAPGGLRKIILATNIAETSLTIDGVRGVIDSGLARQASFDPDRGLDRLDLVRISKASAAQRAGRAGRTAPGVCTRLWTAKEQAALPEFDEPEILRVDLASTLLTLHAFGHSDVRRFGWFQRPEGDRIDSTERLLFYLGALQDGRLTALGKQIAAIPAHPRLARLLIAAAELGVPEDGAAAAAILSEKDILLRNQDSTIRADSDLTTRIEQLAYAEKRGFHPSLRDEGIDPVAARSAAQLRQQFLALVGRKGSSRDGDALSKALLDAFPDRLCKRRENDSAAALCVGGSGMRMHADSGVRDGPLFLALDARRLDRSPRAEAQVRIACRVEEAWLAEAAPHLLTRKRELRYDAKRDRVVAHDETLFIDLPIRSNQDAPVNSQEAGHVLAEALTPRARLLFEEDEPAAAFLARLDLLRTYMPEHPWPPLDESQMREVLEELCANRRSLADLPKSAFAAALKSRLHYPLDRLFEAEAPESIAVPTGNRIRVQYSGAAQPVLAVRLQELFGLTQTPRIAGGRVPVLLHLLSPGYKPVQVTADLSSFWKNTYAHVRKDLKARYPKHSWPDDPLTAPPVAKGRPQK